MKAFQRRARKPTGTADSGCAPGSGKPATAPVAQQAPSEPPQTSPLLLANTPSGQSEYQHEEPTPATENSDASSFCSGWLTHLGLGHRRSSCLVPFQGLRLQGLNGLLQEQHKASMARKEEERLAVLKELLVELAVYFSEVDAYELVEESPEPSPDPKAKQKEQNRFPHRPVPEASISGSPPSLQQPLPADPASPLHSTTPLRASLHSLTPQLQPPDAANADPPSILNTGTKAFIHSSMPSMAGLQKAASTAPLSMLSTQAEAPLHSNTPCTLTEPSTCTHAASLDSCTSSKHSHGQPGRPLLSDCSSVCPHSSEKQAHEGRQQDNSSSFSALAAETAEFKLQNTSYPPANNNDQTTQSMRQSLNIGRRSSVLVQPQPAQTATQLPVPGRHSSVQQPTSVPEEIAFPNASRRSSVQLAPAAPTSAPFPYAGRCSNVQQPGPEAQTSRCSSRQQQATTAAATLLLPMPQGRATRAKSITQIMCSANNAGLEACMPVEAFTRDTGTASSGAMAASSGVEEAGSMLEESRLSRGSIGQDLEGGSHEELPAGGDGLACKAQQLEVLPEEAGDEEEERRVADGVAGVVMRECDEGECRFEEGTRAIKRERGQDGIGEGESQSTCTGQRQTGSDLSVGDDGGNFEQKGVAKGGRKGSRRGRSGAAAAAAEVTKIPITDKAESDANAVKAKHGQRQAAAAAKATLSVADSDVKIEGGRDQGPRLEAGEVEEEQPVQQHVQQELTPLQQLLEVCSQSVDIAQIPSMDAFIGAQADLRKISKIGEGTYGEAFKYNKIVFKVVPVEGKQLINGAPQKLAQEMAAEALIALTLTNLRHKSAGGQEQHNVTPCFVETFEVGVCRGPYTPELVRVWHKWDKAHGSENDPVDSLQSDQLYLVIAMRDCGRDLEKANITSFDQARSLLAQVALTLAIAENAVEFEHRDLHWGNVLVRPAESVSIGVRFKGVDIEVQTHGVTASIIDFTASRLRTMTGALAYCDLSCDPELFKGTKGVMQFDTYRWMRRLNQDDWSSSCLATNCLWMAYLAEMIVKEKATALNVAQKRQLREFRKRASQTLSCGDLVFDELFQGLWIAKDGSRANAIVA